MAIFNRKICTKTSFKNARLCHCPIPPSNVRSNFAFVPDSWLERRFASCLQVSVRCGLLSTPFSPERSQIPLTSALQREEQFALPKTIPTISVTIFTPQTTRSNTFTSRECSEFSEIGALSVSFGSTTFHQRSTLHARHPMLDYKAISKWLTDEWRLYTQMAHRLPRTLRVRSRARAICDPIEPKKSHTDASYR